MKKNVIFVLRRGRLALQELGPSMALLMLPGGYLIALMSWIYRHWPMGSALRIQASDAPQAMDSSTASRRTETLTLVEE